MDRRKLKEGFLVKKGYVRRNWKVRWFILFEDALCYYKKKEDKLSAGEVQLRGSSLVSPCPDYTKKLFVFQLISSNGREYLLQAENDGELKQWSASIASAIRDIESKERKEEKTQSIERIDTIEPKVSVNLPSLAELVDAMQDKDAGISLYTHKVQDNKVYRHCFTGSQVVDWLLSWSFVACRSEGTRVGDSLLEHGHLQPVGLKSRNSLTRGILAETAEINVFCDADNALYRFSALCLTNAEAFEADSDDSTDSDDSDKEQESKIIDGIVVKQGFLVKKGHVRHNWKTRKFFLCKQPSQLYYCKPSKPNSPIRCIKLNGATIEKNSGDSMNGEKKGKQFYGYRFKILASNKSQYILQAGSKDELEEWISKLKFVCS